MDVNKRTDMFDSFSISFQTFEQDGPSAGADFQEALLHNMN